jgi:hypothetical protein
MPKSDIFTSFARIFATVEKGHNLCLKHLREHLAIYDVYPERRYEPVFRLVVDKENEHCFECHKLARQAYYSKLVEERKKMQLNESGAK